MHTAPGVLEGAVVARPGVSVDIADRIMALAAEQLADFKHARKIQIVEAVPRGTSEKVAKAEPRSRLGSGAST